MPLERNPLLKELACSVFLDVDGFVDLCCAPDGDDTDADPRHYRRLAERALARASEPAGLYRNGRWEHWPVDSHTNAVLYWFVHFLDPFLADVQADEGAQVEQSDRTGQRVVTGARLFHDTSAMLLSGGVCARSPSLVVPGLGFPLVDHRQRGRRLDWRNVRVPGVLAANPADSHVAYTAVRLAEFARQMLYVQPFRRFVHAFSLCGDGMRAWLFDRSGGIASHIFSIHEEPLRFLHVLLFYCTGKSDDIGFDPTIRTSVRMPEGGHAWNPGPQVTFDSTTIPFSDSYALATRIGGPVIEIKLDNKGPSNWDNHYAGRKSVRFLLDWDPFFKSKGVISRASTLWGANPLELPLEDFPRVIIKQLWRDPDRPHEGELMKAARGVFGVVQHLWHGDICDVVGTSRKGLKDEEASKTVAEVAIAHSIATAADAPDAARGGPVGVPPPVGVLNESGKRPHDEERSSGDHKRHKPAEQRRRVPFVNRVLSRVIMTSTGEDIRCYTHKREMLEALRDAMAGHRELVKDKGILHRDISINNILVDRSPSPQKGFLIDFDRAIEMAHREESGACHRPVGTPSYMAVEILEKNAIPDPRHDLESFFCVFLHLCTYCEERQQSVVDMPWGYDTSRKSMALYKRGMFTGSVGFGVVEQMFQPGMLDLVDLAKKWRDVLFPFDKETQSALVSAPPDDAGRDRLYSTILEILEEAINQQPATYQPWDRPVYD